MQIPMPSPIDSGSRTSSIPRRKNCGSQSRRGLGQVEPVDRHNREAREFGPFSGGNLRHPLILKKPNGINMIAIFLSH